MQILMNDSKEIISFAMIGGFENGIEVSDIPEDFIKHFSPKRYIYSDDAILFNPNYFDEEQEISVPSPNENTGTDEELRKTYGNLQMSSVQIAKIVTKLAEQITELTKQNVELQNQINDKGVK